MIFKALLKDFTNGYWRKHRNALVYIIELRGGYEAMKNECLQITVTWYAIAKL
jgi:hypothetical protein